MAYRASEGIVPNLALAQALAGDLGWSVFPVSVTKAPLWSKESKYPDGSLNASTDESVITSMFTPFPQALVGVRLDRSGLMCIDIDRHEGVDGMKSYNALKAVYGELPETPVQRSVSGKGYHLILTQASHVIRKNLKGYPGVDFLNHHYIVLNEWLRGRSPYEVKVSALPKLWLEALKVPLRPERVQPVVQSNDPLRDIAPAQYVHDLGGLVPNGAGFVACPGHEDWRPSLKVYNTATEGWFCYQCERGGDVYDFAALVCGLDKDWNVDRRVAATLMETVWTRYEQIIGVRSEF
jgi:hypothetical protein